MVDYQVILFFSADTQKAQIEDALFNMEHFTCLRFVKRTTEVDYLAVEVS
jgi:hypothetical protein